MAHHRAHPDSGTSAVLHALYPVRTRIDMLTAVYLVWSYRRLHRAITALDAVFSAPLMAPPSMALPLHEYCVAASLWQLQWAIESEEARFAREMMIPVEGDTCVSLRAYVHALKDRMADAVKRGLFDDLEDPDPATETARAKQVDELTLEARACLTFAFAHDVRWRRVVMRPPGLLFEECGPDRDQAAAFVDQCVALTAGFLDERLTLAQVAAEAAEAWLRS